MKTSFLIRLGSSALLLGVTAVGCTNAGGPVARSSDGVTGAHQSARLAQDATAAIKSREVDKAVMLAEKSVALSPRDAAARATLGQAYLLAGRFASAETSFSESLSLDAAQSRTRFTLALAQIALGKNEAARATLAALDSAVPQADVGLAVALSGDQAGGIAILERAARGADAGVKARQNLALAYALAGRWTEARVTAEQDVPADQLASRLSQWSQFARPRAPWEQVSSLLGVTASADLGRPVALALADPAPTAAPLASAAADPVAAPAASEETVEVAAVEAPAHPFVAPVVATAEAAPLFAEAAPGRAMRMLAPVQPVAGGKWVIQLGAYSQAASVHAAWARVAGRVPAAGFAPAQSTLVRDGSATFYRLTLAGFGTRGGAVRMCGQIRAKGGQCFVRPAAGEQPILMASAANLKVAMR